MTNPIVSVIIPCYNDEATVGETLDSLQSQTFRDWEAIVVNDGSNDGSADIIRQYGTDDPRIRHIDQENQGPSAARNAGLAMAKGEFVNFLDADDVLLPNMLKRMVSKLRDDTSIGAVNCGWICGDPQLKDLSWSSSLDEEGQLFEQLAHHNLFPCHSIVLRCEILGNVGAFDCFLPDCHCEDRDLWLRVARAGTRFGRISEPLVIYRMNPVSLSRSPLRHFQAGREVIYRGHRPDPRVKRPAPEFEQGCGCDMKEAILKFLIRCVGFAIAKGDIAGASELLETVLAEECLEITPRDMRAMTNSLWFGTAIPKGNWGELWSRVSRPLLQFLLNEEERLGKPGFAIESILAQWYELGPKFKPEAIPWRELARGLHKKALRRLSQTAAL